MCMCSIYVHWAVLTAGWEQTHHSVQLNQGQRWHLGLLPQLLSMWLLGTERQRDTVNGHMEEGVLCNVRLCRDFIIGAWKQTQPALIPRKLQWTEYKVLQGDLSSESRMIDTVYCCASASLISLNIGRVPVHKNRTCAHISTTAETIPYKYLHFKHLLDLKKKKWLDNDKFLYIGSPAWKNIILQMRWQ